MLKLFKECPIPENEMFLKQGAFFSCRKLFGAYKALMDFLQAIPSQCRVFC